MSEDLTSEGQILTELIPLIFRLNGALLTAGDELCRDFKMTSARWQVMGAISREALTASQAARRMGLTRQSVQRVADDLVNHGLAVKRTNPDHKRSPLIELTPVGLARLIEIDARQRVWVNILAKELDSRHINDAAAMIREIITRLETVTEEQ